MLSIAMPARWEGKGRERERERVVTLSPANLGFKSATLIGPHTHTETENGTEMTK